MSAPEPTLHCWLGGDVYEQAHSAAQAVRQIIHLTLLPHPTPGSDVTQTLAELEDLLVALERVLRHHLGRALEASLTDPHTPDTWSSVEQARDRRPCRRPRLRRWTRPATAREAIGGPGHQADAAVTP